MKLTLTISFCLVVLLLAGSSFRQAQGGLHANPGEWANTIALTTHGGDLYTVEANGALYRTNLSNGQWVKIGNSEFAATTFMFADNRNLYTIENSGSLYRINPADGSWSGVGQAGAWRATRALAMLNNNLYSAENSGALYRTNLSSGRWVQVGKPEFANTQFMFADGTNLYTIETDGSLYRVSPIDGSWSRVGRAGDWASTMVGAFLNGRIYTVERNGVLYETNLATGAWKKLGNPEFGNTSYLFVAGSALYSIEGGDLYRISPLNGSWAKIA